MSILSDHRLSSRTRAIIRSLVPVICPSDAEELGLTERIIDYFESYVRAMPPLLRTGLLAGIISYDLAARAYPKSRGLCAADLDPDTANAYFEFWRHGMVLQRTFAQGLKGLVAMSYYEMPEAQAKLGYHPGEWVQKATDRRLELYADEIAAQEKAVFEPDPLPVVEDNAVPFPAASAGAPSQKEAS